MRMPLIIHNMGRGWGVAGHEEERDCNLIPAARDTKMAQYLVLATSDRDAAPTPPAGSDDDSLNCQSY